METEGAGIASNNTSGIAVPVTSVSFFCGSGVLKETSDSAETSPNDAIVSTNFNGGSIDSSLFSTDAGVSFRDSAVFSTTVAGGIGDGDGVSSRECGGVGVIATESVRLVVAADATLVCLRIRDAADYHIASGAIQKMLP